MICVGERKDGDTNEETNEEINEEKITEIWEIYGRFMEDLREIYGQDF